jgi:hypothetical protein
MPLGIEKARLLYEATKHLQFCDIPGIDLKDRLALTTVSAGLRPIGVLEAEGLELERVREQVINHGLLTFTSKAVWSRIEWPGNHPLLRYLQLLGQPSKPSRSRRTLWVCSNPEDRKKLKSRLLMKHEAGLILSYPGCCVQFQIEVDVKANAEFLTALIAKVGSDERSVAQALKDDVGVEVSDDAFALENVPKTDERFPFVIHTACDACLCSDTGQSAQINASYEKLALDVDPGLHTGIVQIRALCARLRAENKADRDRIFTEMQRIQRTALSGEGLRAK